MPTGKPTHYRLTPKAREDLEHIWLYTAENWSHKQADRYIDGITKSFKSIVQTPLIVRERNEFSPPIHIFPHEQHLIIYVIDDDHITIVRLLGGRQDWQAILQKIDN